MSDFALPLSLGTTLGGYRIEKVLGQGGFGITYLASHKEKQGSFAVKEYFPSGAAARSNSTSVSPLSSKKRFFDVGLKDFFDEAMLMTELPPFPGLVRVVAALKKYGTAYCVMEFIDGETMDDLSPRVVQQYGHFPEDLIMRTLENILSALAIVHDKALIHRDIKPSNIMIDRTGGAWLIDFGAARNLNAPRKTHSSFTKGYAPIEQFPNAKLEEGPHTDFFALGVTLYHLVTQSAPPNSRERLTQVEKGQPDPYTPLAGREELEKKYSSKLLDMIDKCCGLYPKDRPAQTTEIFRHLGLKRTALPPRSEAPKKIQLAKETSSPKSAAPAAVGREFGVRELPLGQEGKKPDVVLFVLFLLALAAFVTLVAYYVLDYKGVLS